METCDGSTGEIHVRTEDKSFYVLLDSTNTNCNSFEFNTDKKKIAMKLYAEGADNQMNVTIPKELLNGTFYLRIDGGSTENFLIDDKRDYTTISFSKFCPNNCQYEVEIIGTNVFPSKLQRSSLLMEDQPRAIIVDGKGERIERPRVGQQVLVSDSYYDSGLTHAQPYTLLFEFRNDKGMDEFLAWQSGVAEPGHPVTAGVSWIPESSQQYEIRVFAISGFENPIILSPVRSYQVFVE